MESFSSITATAVPFLRQNVDTDVIIPIQRLVGTGRTGLGPYAFERLRYLPDGSDNPEFPLNQPGYKGSQLLLADENFGCGSSRESAVFALHDYGIRCVIVPSFGDIFHNNCFKNGLLPIMLPEAEVTELRAQAGTMQGTPFAIDLAAQTVTGVDGVARRFEIDPFRKRLLLEGVDEIDFTLGHMDKIKAFEAKR